MRSRLFEKSSAECLDRFRLRTRRFQLLDGTRQRTQGKGLFSVIGLLLRYTKCYGTLSVSRRGIISVLSKGIRKIQEL